MSLPSLSPLFPHSLFLFSPFFLPSLSPLTLTPHSLPITSYSTNSLSPLSLSSPTPNFFPLLCTLHSQQTPLSWPTLSTVTHNPLFPTLSRIILRSLPTHYPNSVHPYSPQTPLSLLTHSPPTTHSLPTHSLLSHCALTPLSPHSLPSFPTFSISIHTHSLLHTHSLSSQTPLSLSLHTHSLLSLSPHSLPTNSTHSHPHSLPTLSLSTLSPLTLHIYPLPTPHLLITHSSLSPH